MPMSKFFTLNYLISSYQARKKEVEVYQLFGKHTEFDQMESEPSQNSIDVILNFASQYDVVKSANTGYIELNLN